ncbi:MAG: hypothetical protein GY858_09910 [Candidatus Omnitrophica bacterium]|nr:hypothetical protein [Candidatus Omnitrophota bacterium]
MPEDKKTIKIATERNRGVRKKDFKISAKESGLDERLVSEDLNIPSETKTIVSEPKPVSEQAGPLELGKLEKKLEKLADVLQENVEAIKTGGDFLFKRHEGLIERVETRLDKFELKTPKEEKEEIELEKAPKEETEVLLTEQKEVALERVNTLNVERIQRADTIVSLQKEYENVKKEELGEKNEILKRLATEYEGQAKNYKFQRDMYRETMGHFEKEYKPIEEPDLYSHVKRNRRGLKKYLAGTRSMSVEEKYENRGALYSHLTVMSSEGYISRDEICDRMFLASILVETLEQRDDYIKMLLTTRVNPEELLAAMDEREKRRAHGEKIGMDNA